MRPSSAGSSARRLASTNWRLLALASAGEDDAFRDLVLRHQARATAFAAGLLGDARLAEDVTQRAFANIHKKARTLVPRARFSTLLMKVVRNLCLQELARRKEPLSFSDLEGEERERPAQIADAAAFDPARSLLAAEFEAALKAALAELPPLHREALWLAESGLSYAEIVEVMEASLPAVKTWIHRARKDLAARMEPYLERGAWPQ